MKKLALVMVAVAALAGCTTAERDATLGGAAGAAIGGLATGRVGGAVVGGVVGAASGVLIGQATRTGWCVYRDRQGRTYEARCRAG
jgi:hypothetical protein